MEIGPVHNSKPIQPSTSQSSRRKADDSDTPKPSPARTDTVDISEDARRKLAELADRALAEMGGVNNEFDGGVERHGSLAESRSGKADQISERLDEIRRRIDSGYYDRPDIRGDIADRLSDEMGL
jgi:hypothetical protein